MTDESGQDDADEETEDENQYGGGDQDIDAVEQTERMQDDEDGEENAGEGDADDEGE